MHKCFYSRGNEFGHGAYGLLVTVKINKIHGLLSLASGCLSTPNGATVEPREVERLCALLQESLWTGVCFINHDPNGSSISIPFSVSG